MADKNQESLRRQVAERVTQIKREGISKTREPLISLPRLDPTRAAYVESLPAWVDGEAGERVLIVLTTPPCPRHCTMCGFRSQALEGVKFEDLVAQLDSVLKSSYVADKRLLRASLCTASSTFNSDIPSGFWEEAMRMVSRYPQIKEVDVESRAGEVLIPANLERITHLQEILGDEKRLAVGIGLETLDDFIRNDINGKGLSRATFENAVRALGAAELGAYAYVILKLPGLEEQEAIDECVRTLRYFFDLASRSKVSYSRANIKPLFIPRGTVIERLFEDGMISTPTLWSLLEVHMRARAFGLTFSPLTDEGLSDGRFATNCPDCTPRVREAIHMFNATQDIRTLDVAPCECKETPGGMP